MGADGCAWLQGKAEVLALAKRMLRRKEKESIVDAAYNRCANLAFALGQAQKAAQFCPHPDSQRKRMCLCACAYATPI